jgi:hypothetical protein
MQHNNNIFFLFAMEAASADEISSISKILELMYTAGKHAALMAGMNQVVVLKFSGLRSR